MNQEQPQRPSQEALILNQIQGIGDNMTFWLKFLGIMNIVGGALSALSLWGIVIAWLPIWLGVILLQAANKISSSRYSNNRSDLVLMMDKLRLYFLINGVLIIVSILVGIIGIVVFGSFMMRLLDQGGFDTF